MPAPRLHRLPQRLDYTLIPAPLDLSLPITDEKSPLPAIIVTPSSPSCATDFSIAFLAPPVKPSYLNRLSSRLNIKARTVLLILLPLFILACHVITHRLATLHPHLNFDMHTQHDAETLQSIPRPAGSGPTGWFDLVSVWDAGDAKISRGFVVNESPH